MPGQDHFAALAAPGVRGLDQYVPGKPVSQLERELGIRDSIKLASNENPLGPPVASLDAVRNALEGLALYPDGAAFDLKAALSAHLGVPMRQLTVGNGSNEILSIIAETFLAPGLAAVYSEYAFVVYALAVQAAGAVHCVASANPADHTQPLGHDLRRMRELTSDATRLAFIANPNNPTGTLLSPDGLREFIDSLPDHVIVVLDEAYSEYLDPAQRVDTVPWIASRPNLVVCRTFSKMYALAGLRVGYAVSHPGIADLLNRVRQPFNVNTLGQVAAVAALGAHAHVERSRELNRRGREQLRQGLASLGWRVPESSANFVLADTGGPAQPWYEQLLRAGIIVRPVANYGLPRHLRITVGLPEQNTRLLDAVRTIRDGGSVA